MRRPDESDVGLAGLLEESVRSALVDTHTALPGRIAEYDAATQTATVEVEVYRRRWLRDGEAVTAPIRPITGVPVMHPRGGGFALTLPVVAGDPCLVVFAERDISGWLGGLGAAPPPTARMHDYVDAIAIPGLWSAPEALDPPPSGDAAEIRSDDGSVRVSVSSSGVTIEAGGAGGVAIETVSGPVAIDSTGAVTITRGASELLDLLSQTLQALANESVGGGATPIDGQATYAALKVLVDAMRV